jgi:hypothetical protein
MIDYKQLSTMPDLSPTDKKVVQRALAVLPGQTQAAQEREMGEMMGKLKEVTLRLSKLSTIFRAYLTFAAWKRHFKALWPIDG